MPPCGSAQMVPLTRLPAPPGQAEGTPDHDGPGCDSHSQPSGEVARAGKREFVLALRLLLKTMPKNVDPGQVAVKVATLNGLYATSIYGVVQMAHQIVELDICLLYTSPSPRDRTRSRMPSSA